MRFLPRHSAPAKFPKFWEGAPATCLPKAYGSLQGQPKHVPAPMNHSCIGNSAADACADALRQLGQSTWLPEPVATIKTRIEADHTVGRKEMSHQHGTATQVLAADACEQDMHL